MATAAVVPLQTIVLLVLMTPPRCSRVDYVIDRRSFPQDSSL